MPWKETEIIHINTLQPLSDFKIFYGMVDHTALRDVYQNMQKNYVILEKDLLPFEFATSQWKKLQEVLNDMENGK